MLTIAMLQNAVPTFPELTQKALAWLWANRTAVLAATVWLIANVAPRPHPEQQTNRVSKIFWLVIDRLCILTADKIPGSWKAPLVASPEPDVSPPQAGDKQ